MEKTISEEFFYRVTFKVGFRGNRPMDLRHMVVTARNITHARVLATSRLRLRVHTHEFASFAITKIERLNPPKQDTKGV